MPAFVAKIITKLTVKFIPYLIVIPVLVFYALSLASCVSTSPGIPELYIVKLEPSANNSSPLEVRLGYYGICAKANDTKFACQSTSGASADTVFANLFHVDAPAGNGTGASANSTKLDASQTEAKSLIATALVLQSQIFISILAGAAFLFFISLPLLFLLKRSINNPNPDKPRRAMLIKRLTYGCMYLSVGLVFTSALATSETAGALHYSSGSVTNSPINISPGISLQVIQWMAFGFSLLFALAETWLLRPRDQWNGDVEK
ncbi:hypothetical protein GQ53DRAFT_733666 [Thozetella sp. PMI_491]|nr:hypothetical protein GQ53DRAFT_733666 [Thozetella sp. PMI_491]